MKMGSGAQRYLIATVVLIIIGVTGACTRDSKPTSGSGALSEAERTVVERYLTALETGDVKALGSLAVPGTDSTAEAQKRIAVVRGRRIGDVELEHRREFGADLTRIEIEGRYDDGSPYTDSILLSRIVDRWYVALGSATPARSPASISP